jgi:hypothetical protein
MEKLKPSKNHVEYIWTSYVPGKHNIKKEQKTAVLDTTQAPRNVLM